MRRNNIIVALIVCFAAGLAAAAFWLGQRGPSEDNGPPPVEDRPFPTDEFFLSFDEDRSGWIDEQEFERAYKRAAERKVDAFQFSRGPGQPALTAEDAFKSLDVSKDKRIDREDMQAAFDKAWVKFKNENAAKGLEARIWRRKWITLNPHQAEVLNKEMGAESRGELPFGGKFFAKKYFAAKRFVSLVDAGGETHTGFLLEDREVGRLRLLRGDATLLVFEPAAVRVTDVPDAPQVEYINTVEKTSYEDPAANLKLARRCKELGLNAEAGMMYARVLVFELDNQEALDALGFRKEGPMFVPKS